MMLPVELPAEVFDFILDCLPEEDDSYINSLKSLSLTTTRYTARVQKRLFRKLAIPFDDRHRPVQELLDIVSSNSSIRTSICEILLVNLFGSKQSERVEEEAALVANLFDTLESSICTHLTLDHICRDYMFKHNIVPLIPSIFTSLSRLMIIKGPAVDLCVVNQITTLKCLELISVSVAQNFWHKNFRRTGAIVPALERLAIIGVEYATCGTPMPIFGVSGIFDLRGLKEFAMQVVEADQGDILLEELVPLCGGTLTSLSFHVGKCQLRHICRWEFLREFKAVRRLDLYFPHGLQAGMDNWYDSIDPRTEDFKFFWPPPSLEVLSFRFRWHESMYRDPFKWAPSQVQIMNEKIEKYFESRWRNLRSIEFQMFFDRNDLKAQEGYVFELKDSDVQNHRFVTSVLPKRMITRPEWPCYA